MGRAADSPPLAIDYAGPALRAGLPSLPRQLIVLALPILAENMLHMAVGLTDVYLAGHLKVLEQRAPATAAVGVVGYVLWLIGLITGAVATGSTAIIARAVGAKHRRLANRVCGQTIGAAAIGGTVLAIGFYLLAAPLARLTGLSGDAQQFTLYYFRILSLSLPFSMVMLAGGACLRGAGDTLTPAASMIVVDVINVVASFAFARGWWGLPEMGFRGIAVGTVIAYVIGGGLLVGVLLRGSHSLRLFPHRLRPHWLTLKRILRIGLPSGLGETLAWVAQFAIVLIINRIDPTNVSAAAHIVTVRVESLSYLAGYALSIAAATLVGQNLGRHDPARATRTAYLALAFGVSFMAAWGVVFALGGRQLASFFNDDPRVVDLAARCLFVTAFAQVGFAAALVFAGVLRGAGDTVALMSLNLVSTLCLRLAGVLVATYWLHLGLVAIWVVLGGELTIRGLLFYLRFFQGKWKDVRV